MKISLRPRQAQKVYLIYENTILVDYPGYFGDRSFIVLDFNEERNFNSLEWRYDEYKAKWFTSLQEAKESLKHKLEAQGKKNVNIVKITDNFYGADYAGRI